jgi:hypothetical protein
VIDCDIDVHACLISPVSIIMWHVDVAAAEVDCEDGMALAESLGWQFFETSAKQNINVEAAFEAILSRVRGCPSTSLKFTHYSPSTHPQIGSMHG